MQSLPLSWALSSQKEFISELHRQNSRNLIWVPYGTIENKAHFYNFISKQVLHSPADFIIRGCNKYHVQELSQHGFTSVRIGMEAVLETSKNHFEKKSLLDLVKRGLRKGNVKQVSYSHVTVEKFNKFKQKTVHSRKPQLKNLFQTEFNGNNLLYVFESKNNEWLGAILVSVNSNEKLHTELILRKAGSPIGIVEAMIYKIFLDAKDKGYTKVSLGEVPFMLKEKSYDSFRVYLAFKLGSLFRFAYNYKGLYNFKNKFNPQWEYVYLSVKPKLKFKHLFFLFLQSNLYKLVIFQFTEKLKSAGNLLTL